MHTRMHHRRTGIVGALVGVSVGVSVGPKVGNRVGEAEGEGVVDANEGAGVGNELGDLDANIYPCMRILAQAHPALHPKKGKCMLTALVQKWALQRVGMSRCMSV